MTPGTRVAIERPTCATAEGVAADRLTGRTGTVVTGSHDPWVAVKVDGVRGNARTFRTSQLEILSTPTTPEPAPCVDFAAELEADT